MVVTDTRGASDVERDSFADLFLANAARLVRLAALLGDDDPEDAVQESFCKLYAARGRIGQGDPRIVSYLNRIVVNEVRSRHRRKRTARIKAHLVGTPVALTPSDDHEARRAVLDALSRSPQRTREALVLRYWLDLPLNEIADAMKVRPGTVKSLISRGLDALATDLGVKR